MLMERVGLRCTAGRSGVVMETCILKNGSEIQTLAVQLQQGNPVHGAADGLTEQDRRHPLPVGHVSRCKCDQIPCVAESFRRILLLFSLAASVPGWDGHH